MRYSAECFYNFPLQFTLTLFVAGDLTILAMSPFDIEYSND